MKAYTNAKFILGTGEVLHNGVLITKQNNFSKITLG